MIISQTHTTLRSLSITLFSHSGRRAVLIIDGERYPKQDSIWCNPYKISETESRSQVIDKYRKYITEKIKTEKLESELQKLKGKTLGCWCKPESCHGDVLVELLSTV